MVYMHLGTMSKIGHLSIIFLLIFYFFQNNQLTNYNISDYYKNIELTPDEKRKLRMNKKKNCNNKNNNFPSCAPVNDN